MPSRKNVKMDMEHRLSGAGAVVDDQPVAPRVQSFFLGDFFCREKKMSDEFPVFFGHGVNFGKVFSRDYENMDGGLGIDVFKSGYLFVFVNNFRRDFFCDDLAENAVCLRTHRFSPHNPNPDKPEPTGFIKTMLQ